MQFKVEKIMFGGQNGIVIYYTKTDWNDIDNIFHTAFKWENDIDKLVATLNAALYSLNWMMEETKCQK